MATSSLKKFTIADDTASAPDASLARTRGKNSRVGIAVRLTHEDWHRATDLAMREGTSLQCLLVAGLSELLRQRGLPPLHGSVFDQTKLSTPNPKAK